MSLPSFTTSKLRTSRLSLRIHSDMRMRGAESTLTSAGKATPIPGSGVGSAVATVASAPMSTTKTNGAAYVRARVETAMYSSFMLRRWRQQGCVRRWRWRLSVHSPDGEFLSFGLWSGLVARTAAAPISAWGCESLRLSALPPSKQRIGKEAAPAPDRGGRDLRENEALPERGCDRVVDGNAELGLEALDKDRAAHVCADDRHRVDPRACDCAGHLSDFTFCNFREREVVLKTRVPLGGAQDTSSAPILDNSGLDVVAVGSHKADARDACALEDFPKCQDRGAGGYAGRRGDPLAELLVALETEPASRRPVPCDDVDLGVSEQFGRAQDLILVELTVGGLRDRDLSHLKAAEMRTNVRHS